VNSRGFGSEPIAAATIEVLPDSEERRAPVTGAVSSLQEAELGIPTEALERLWRAESLEGLARSYWLYLQRVSRGLIRVAYEDRARTVYLLTRRMPLLRFGAPEYAPSSAAASVTWRIDRGLLVAAEGRGSGWLRIEVRRDVEGKPDTTADGRRRVRVAVEVRNFYPWLRGTGWFARLGAWIYSQTQVRIHRRIAIGFLTSLASLELPRSRNRPTGSGARIKSSQ
jgi:hypothetical protein